MQSMADRLILLRNKYNLSQTDVAHQIGVTPALISAYEKLERKPSIDKLVALADIFHGSTDYILGRTFKDDSAAVLSVDGLSEKQIRIVRELIYELRSNGKTEF